MAVGAYLYSHLMEGFEEVMGAVERYTFNLQPTATWEPAVSVCLDPHFLLPITLKPFY